MGTPFRVEVENPEAVAVTSYVPTGRLLKRYWPAALLVVVDFTPVLLFVAVTVALGIAEPVESKTVPTRSPLVS